jgi:hypothetical protein
MQSRWRKRLWWAGNYRVILHRRPTLEGMHDLLDPIVGA